MRPLEASANATTKCNAIESETIWSDRRAVFDSDALSRTHLLESLPPQGMSRGPNQNFGSSDKAGGICGRTEMEGHGRPCKKLLAAGRQNKIQRAGQCGRRGTQGASWACRPSNFDSDEPPRLHILASRPSREG